MTKMNKTAQTELRRLFLVHGLPEPLSHASSHLQLFDNYIKGTRLRLRQIRDPYSKVWTRILQQHFPVGDGHESIGKLAEIYLHEDEYALFEQFEGREIRKNRYFHDIDGISVAFDVYLGPLWGLNTARVDFEELKEMADFTPPPSFILEVSDDPFFAGDSLVDRRFEDVQLYVAGLSADRESRAANSDPE